MEQEILREKEAWGWGVRCKAGNRSEDSENPASIKGQDTHSPWHAMVKQLILWFPQNKVSIKGKALGTWRPLP